MTDIQEQVQQVAGDVEAASEATLARVSQVEKVELIPLAFIKPSRDNFRRTIGDVSGLAAAIKAQGVLQPLMVAPPDESGIYTIHYGERRFHAAKLAGLTEVPAIVRDFESEADRLEAGFLENAAREDLTEVDEAHAFHRLMEVAGLSQRKLATRLGVSQAHVSRRLALLELPEAAITALDTGSITVEEAVVLSNVKDEPEAVEALIKQAGGGKRDMRRAVEEHQQAQELEAKKASARAELEKKGIRILEGLPEKGKWLANQNAWNNVIEITPSEHRREPCHAGVINRWGKAEFVCTEPKRHSRKGASKVKTPVASRSDEELAEQRRAREQKKARLAADEVREQFIKGLLSKSKLGAGEAWTVFIDAMPELRQANDVERLAARFLDVEPVKRSYFEDYAAALSQYAAEGTVNTVRVGLAFALATVEVAIRREYFDYRNASAHFRYLAKKGYSISEAEQAELDKHAPKGEGSSKVAEQDRDPEPEEVFELDPHPDTILVEPWEPSDGEPVVVPTADDPEAPEAGPVVQGGSVIGEADNQTVEGDAIGEGGGAVDKPD